MHRFPVLSLLVALLVTPWTVAAQRVDSLTAGARVRVHRHTTERQSVTGVYRSRDSLSFVIGAVESLATLTSIPMRDIDRVELHVGMLTRGEAFQRGAGRGALIGLGFSAIAMTVGMVAEVRGLMCDVCFTSGPSVAAVVSGAFLVTSTAIGGVSGLNDRERWQRVALPP